MGCCKGNLGNLMQHWVLSETVHALDLSTRDSSTTLLFVASHAMAPWSVPLPAESASQKGRREPFDKVRATLRADGCPYEQAWKALSGELGLPYPSSAVFVRKLWRRSLSLMLCEADRATAKEVAAWLSLPELSLARLPGGEPSLYVGDWRSRLGSTFAQFSSGADLLFIEMDPMRFERHPRKNGGGDDPAALFLEDLEMLTGVLAERSQPVLLQVSSYSANNNNPPAVAEECIRASLEPCRFSLCGKVQLKGEMISLVFVRDLNPLWEGAGSLHKRFHDWAIRTQSEDARP